MSNRNPIDVVVLGCTPPTPDMRALEIAAFLGVEAEPIFIAPADLRDGAAAGTIPRSTCLIVDAESLVAAAGAMQSGVSGLGSLIGAASQVFTYGWQPTDRHAEVLKALSAGSLAGVRPHSDTDAVFEVAEAARSWAGPLSGLSINAPKAKKENAFVEGPSSPRGVLIRLGGKPFLACAEHANSHVYFTAASSLADLDVQVPREGSLLSWFSQLAPLMMFLRGVLGERVWQNHRPQACLIIDDPLLEKRYGFLDYARLAEAMRRQRFSACIAFIPWNYRRSRKEIAGPLFSSGMIYLCVHGCDHTGAEFSTRNRDSLGGKASLALERMRAHTRFSGLPFDDVMVFPQGYFSEEALDALNAAGYLAAINTHLQPSTRPQGLPLRDLLSVAVTRFSDFPLFGRRYPRDIADVAFDLFLGKPALLVEHHGYFRNGYSALEAFAERVNALDERLEWTSPAAICSHACRTRAASDGEFHVEFYTSRFSLKNETAHPRRYVLLRRQTAAGPAPSVTVNGNEWNATRSGGAIEIRLRLGPGEPAEVRILAAQPDVAGVSFPQTAAYRARVRVRRMLSEFRDNHVDTSPVLSGLLSAVRSFRTRRSSGNVIRIASPLTDS